MAVFGPQTCSKQPTQCAVAQCSSHLTFRNWTGHAASDRKCFREKTALQLAQRDPGGSYQREAERQITMINIAIIIIILKNESKLKRGAL